MKQACWPRRRVGARIARCAPATLTIVAVMLAASAVIADENVPQPRVMVDFSNPRAFTLHPEQAEASIVAGNSGVPGKSAPALQIATEAKASWPGVSISPRDGKWDLAGFDRVEMGVVNPQDVPVRVLLNINNPGATGDKHCNVASVTVLPGRRATLVVPFGTWHGDATHPIDQKNIVSVKVMLDEPGRGHRFLVENIQAMPFDRSAMQQVFADPFYEQLRPPFGRGINLGNMLEAPREGDWGVTLKPEYFEIIKQAGFDAVRIPVRWPAHAQDFAPYRIDPAFFSRVDEALRQALRQHLQAVLNIHYYDELMQEPAAHRERFVAIWRQIAEHYRDYPAEVAFELLNEPMKNLSAELWNPLVADTLAVIRPTNPTREVVVGPVAWNSIKELATLELPESDRHLIVTVHYYDPFHFTHQGAQWVGPESRAWLGTEWLGTEAEQRAIERDFDAAISWAVRNRRPLFLGEFGAYDRADMDSRARWTRFVAEQAVARKMGFAYWEFCAGFGAYNPERQAWIVPLKDALLFRVNEK